MTYKKVFPDDPSSTKKDCLTCKKNKPAGNFYVSNSKFHTDKRFPVCKDCINKDLDINNIQEVRRILLELNRPFISTIWQNALIEGSNKKSAPFGLYIKTVILNFKEMTYTDSDADVTEAMDKSFATLSPSTIENDSVIERNELVRTDDKRNEEDVLRMLSYDPFELETPTDKRHLYNKLVDFLDESTLEDSFKLPAVIEIVKTFNQIDKINSALSHITSSVKSVSDNVGGISSLVTAKEKMLKTVLALAKDNGISVNHNNNKSKGAGTLSGIIKQLHEKGIGAAEINIYDVETCEGMRQVADISNRSILDQLMLNENDYVEMIKEQREMIIDFESKCSAYEEENRQLKIKLKHYETSSNS